MWCTSQPKARKRGNDFNLMNDVGKSKKARQRVLQHMLDVVEILKVKAFGQVSTDLQNFWTG